MGFRSKISSTSFLLFAVRSRPSSQTGDAFAAVLLTSPSYVHAVVYCWLPAKWLLLETDGRTDRPSTNTAKVTTNRRSWSWLLSGSKMGWTGGWLRANNERTNAGWFKWCVYHLILIIVDLSNPRIIIKQRTIIEFRWIRSIGPPSIEKRNFIIGS